MTELWFVAGLLFLCFGLIVLRGAPYVPTHTRQLEKLFNDLYSLSEKDTLVDLGSGDGIVLMMAAKKGAAAIGYELNPLLVWWSRVRLRRYPRTKVLITDYLLKSKLPAEATVVYAFSTSHSIKSIERKLIGWSQNRSFHFISYGFLIPDRKVLRSKGPMNVYYFEPDKARALQS